jgi:hypothetical protein
MLELQALTEELITPSADYYNNLVLLLLTAINTLYSSISHTWSIINCIFFCITDERKCVPYFLFSMVGCILVADIEGGTQAEGV